MAAHQYANNASTTLSGSVTAGATTINVASATGFPTIGKFTIIVDTEIMLVTGVAGTIWTVQRAYDGSAATSHNNNAAVTSIVTVDSLLNAHHYDVRAYGAKGNGTTDDTAAIQAAIDAAIATGGVVRLQPLNYRITAPLDFSALKGTLRSVTFEGAGMGGINVSTGYTTRILNDHTGPAIKVYGNRDTSQPIVGFRLRGLYIEAQSGIGTNYLVDLDYITASVEIADVFLSGQSLTGGGLRFRNFGQGQSTLERVMVRGFTSGVGFYLASEATANVSSAPNSGNIALTACSAAEVLTGFHIRGDNVLNDISLVSCKAVNSSDITGSVGFKIETVTRGISLVSPHAERFSTGYQLDGTEHTVLMAPMASYPSPGVPDANSAGIRIKGAATGCVVWGAILLQTHYGVSFEGTARTNIVMGSDRNAARVLTAFSQDISTGGKTNVLIKTEGEPFVWTMPAQIVLTGGRVHYQRALSPTALSANTNDFAPTDISYGNWLRISASAPVNLTGIAAQTDGAMLLLTNIGGANAISLTHQDANSAAANRFVCPGAAAFSLGSNKSVWIAYDGASSRWRVIG